MPVTQQRLKHLLDYDYDPLTGVFTCRVQRGKLSVGSVAGSLNVDGYVQIQIDRKNYYGHQLAWLYVYGSWPTYDIDHEDTEKDHNWISNLRPCTQSQNNGNERLSKNNTSGFKGVVFDNARKKWKAQIKVNRGMKYLGRYDDKQDAIDAYWAAATKYFGPFARAA